MSGRSVDFQPGILTEVNVRSQNGTLFGEGSTGAFGHRFLAGLQVHTTQRNFVFGDYKYLVAN